MSDFLGTIKALINARVFIRIVTFHREGVDVYKKLECSQSLFEKTKTFCLFYHFSTMFSYCMIFCCRLRTVNSFCL